MRIWVQADVTNLELSKKALLPLKTNHPCCPAPVTSSIISDHCSRLGNSRKAVLCLLWNWHTGVCCQLSVKLLWHQSCWTFYTQLEAAFTWFPSPQAFQPLFSASPFSQQNENVKSVLRPTFLGTFTWVKMSLWLWVRYTFTELSPEIPVVTFSIQP